MTCDIFLRMLACLCAAAFNAAACCALLFAAAWGFAFEIMAWTYWFVWAAVSLANLAVLGCFSLKDVVGLAPLQPSAPDIQAAAPPMSA